MLVKLQWLKLWHSPFSHKFFLFNQIPPKKHS
jgi:hypothetical protein